MHGVDRRRTGELMSRAARTGCRCACDDDRGATWPSPSPTRVRRARRRPVRHLHARNDPGRRGARQESDNRSNEDRPRRQSVSMHWLLGDLSIDRGGHEKKKPRRTQRAQRRRRFGFYKKKPQRSQRTQRMKTLRYEGSAYEQGRSLGVPMVWAGNRKETTRAPVCIAGRHGLGSKTTQRSLRTDHRRRHRGSSGSRSGTPRVPLRRMSVSRTGEAGHRVRTAEAASTRLWNGTTPMRISHGSRRRGHDHRGDQVCFSSGGRARRAVDFVSEAVRSASGTLVQLQRSELEPRRHDEKGQRLSRVKSRLGALCALCGFSPEQDVLCALCALRGFFW